jgi:hypothetical protein
MSVAEFYEIDDVANLTSGRARVKNRFSSRNSIGPHTQTQRCSVGTLTADRDAIRCNRTRSRPALTLAGDHVARHGEAREYGMEHDHLPSSASTGGALLASVISRLHRASNIPSSVAPERIFQICHKSIAVAGVACSTGDGVVQNEDAAAAWRYRQRAREVRAIAGEIQDPGVRSALMRVAGDYERMALGRLRVGKLARSKRVKKRTLGKR